MDTETGSTTFDSSLSPLHHIQQQHQQSRLIPTVASPFPSSSYPSIIVTTPGSSTIALLSKQTSCYSAHSLHTKNKCCCRSLLDIQPQETVDWLKCFIHISSMSSPTISPSFVITQEDDKLINHDHQQPNPKDFPITLGVSKDFKTRCSQGAEEIEGPTNIFTTRPHYGYLSGRSMSFKSIVSTASMSDSYYISRNENHAEDGRMTSFTTSGSNSSNSPTNPANVGLVTAPASVAHSEVKTGLTNPLVGEQQTLTNSVGGTDASAAPSTRISATSKSTHVSECTGATANINTNTNAKINVTSTQSNTNADTNHNIHHVQTDHNKTSNHNNDGTVSSSNITKTCFPISTPTTTATDTVATTSIFAALISLSPAVFNSATTVVQERLIHSMNATTAFLYRTFSPTYRVSKMYVDSWTNGSQRRGLERIKNSVVRGDAFTLVRGATTHMQSVWNQVMAAYRIKNASSSAAARSNHRRHLNKITHVKSNDVKTDTNASNNDRRHSNGNNSSDTNGNSNSSGSSSSSSSSSSSRSHDRGSKSKTRP
ncbi:hypothetical protein BX616_008645 [Lobosporangium transversale]|nr:hypothetical protein BX616_008645 [Lobosporangium transversale]